VDLYNLAIKFRSANETKIESAAAKRAVGFARKVQRLGAPVFCAAMFYMVGFLQVNKVGGKIGMAMMENTMIRHFGGQLNIHREALSADY